MFLNLFAFSQKITITDKYKNFKETTFVLSQEDVELEGVFLGDKKGKKPLVIFIQGSGLTPIYARTKEKEFLHIIPSDSLIDVKKYNYVFLSKPGVPLVVDIDELNKDYNYVNELTIDYNFKYNNLEFNVKSYSNLIKKVHKLCSYSDIILIGHSQGARVVAELATNPKVTKVVYMSADPLGRLASQYDIEFSKFEKRNNEKLEFYDSLFEEELKDSIFWGDKFSSWKSFSKPSLISLTKSTIPILIIYGDLDKNCPNCYVFSSLPYYYSNIKVNKYKNYSHNYKDLNNVNNWSLVLKDIFSWIEEQ